MQPQPSLMTQLTNTMATGGSPMNVVTPGAPTYEPGITPPPPTPMPNKSPTTMMHLGDALKRRGMSMPNQLQQLQQPSPEQQTVTLPDIPDTNPQQPGNQVPLSEVDTIIKAMETHLKHKDKQEAKMLDLLVNQGQPAQTQMSI